MLKFCSFWVWDDYGSYNKNEEYKERGDMGDKMKCIVLIFLGVLRF